MNNLRVMTVKRAAFEDPVQCIFFSDRSLSKHLPNATLVKGSNVTLLSYI